FCPTLCISLFSFYFPFPLPLLPSFPTRRSSDLASVACTHNDPCRRESSFPASPLLFASRSRQGKAPFLSCRPVHDPYGGGSFCQDRKSTRLNSSHVSISYAVFCLKKKKKKNTHY